MPYRVERRPSCPPDRPYAVILESTDEVVACHASLDGARRQIKAIYAAEQPTAKQQPTSSAVHVDTIIGEEERRRRLMKFAPQVLIKGDYVGHPFRGNQWVDASGVSRGVAGSSVGDADLGAGPALTDYVAAQSQGQPFSAFTELPPDVAAAVKKRDAILDKRAALGEEAERMFEDHLATLSDYDAQTMRGSWSYRGTENKIRWAEEQDQGFADRVQQNSRALDEAFDYYELERRVMTNILVQAGMRQRTAAEIDAIRDEMTYRSRTFDEQQAIEEARARDPLNLSYTEFERDGKGGRLRSRTTNRGVTSASYLDDEREIIGKLSFAPLLERGMTTQQIGELYESARRSAEVMLRQRTAGLYMTTAALDRQQANDIKKIERFVEDAEVSVTVPPKTLTKILESERFKTQFETESSGGFLLPQARMHEEASRFGYPPNLNPVFRPVYGMVETGGVKLPSQRGNQQYGSALVVLKDDVRARTTFTVGDSLSNINPSAPLLKPSAQPRVVGAYPLSGEKPPYLEAQVHGGVKASDIDRVVFESDGTAKTKPSATLLKKLDTLKIPYEIVAVAPNVEKHRLGATVLIKGDFVGHPFRGNQWVDASGVSRLGARSGTADGDNAQRRPAALEPTSDLATAMQGQALNVLSRESFSPRTDAALTALNKIIDRRWELEEEFGEDGALETPEYRELQAARDLAATEFRDSYALDYLKALGFEPQEGEPEVEVYRYEQVSRTAEGRKITEPARAQLTFNPSQSAYSSARWETVRGPDGELITRLSDDPSSFEGLTPSRLIDGRRLGPRDTAEGEQTARVMEGPVGYARAEAAYAAMREKYGLPEPHSQMFLTAKALKERGIPDDVIGYTFDHALGVSRNVGLRNWFSPSFEYRPASPKEVKAILAEQERVLKDAPVSVTVPANKVGAILKDGRLKSHFETGTSGGKNVTSIRDEWEAVMFGYPTGMNPENRPIYGMVETNGVKPSSARGNEQYGQVTLVLKDSVRERTTATAGDSLNLNPDYVPLTNPSQRRTLGRISDFEPYYEAQVHSGVKTSDIARAVIDVAVRDRGEWKIKQPAASMLKALDKAGIPYEIVNGRPNDATEPLTKSVAFSPLLVLKGDYVGHPFRGNQWVDATGASRGEARSGADPVRFSASYGSDGFEVDINGIDSFMTRQHGGEILEGEDRSAALDYMSALWFEDINTTLRLQQAQGGSLEDSVLNPDPEQKARIVNSIKKVTQLFEGRSLDSDVVVYRGVNDDDGMLREQLESGEFLTDGAFLSTSLNPVVAVSASEGMTTGDRTSEALILEIRVPKGTPALALDSLVGQIRDSDYEDAKKEGLVEATVKEQGYMFGSEILLAPRTPLRFIENRNDPLIGNITVVEVAQ